MSELFNAPQGGDCIISDDVIITIAISAILEVPGVAGMAPRGVLANGKRAKAVRVTAENGEITLDIYVNLLSTARIPDVSAEIQKRVKSEVQDMTGNPVTKINIHVENVVFEDKAEESASAPDEE